MLDQGFQHLYSRRSPDNFRMAGQCENTAFFMSRVEFCLP
ncbi:hypothetical protein A33K_18584 [Burkholderia humptydooensis MSMB43]|uniref:Uncharacterized protein n=1 Tax=Burkholderia humptydooensis MSMB43 TaxID=441157 RepID=A0ABN0FXR0_9BURK|nr:hypothetical protein A33K_18584 [Burkholderia humptydooensis MSMB43]